MSVHQLRRFYIVWMPAFLAGIAFIAFSAHLTATLNGLTVLGAITALVGLGAAAHDNRTGGTP